MKRKTWKRLTALLLCAALFAVMPAAAGAADTVEIVTIDYPRLWDATSEGWGHPDLSLMGGWTKAGHSHGWTFVLNGSYTGKLLYCLEPGIGLADNSRLTHYGEDYWENYSAEENVSLTAEQVRDLTGRIMKCGWQGNFSDTWSIYNEAQAENIAAAIATQLLLWETVVGERDASFGHVDASGYGCDSVRDLILPEHPLYGRIFANYDRIEAAVRENSVLPSFMEHSAEDALSYEFLWNGEGYSLTLQDTNGVLEKYEVTGGGELRLSADGDLLNVETDTLPETPFLLTAVRKDANRSGTVIWGDGVSRGGLQDCVTYGETVSDPNPGYVYLKAPEQVRKGIVRIVKRGEVYASASEADGLWEPVFEEGGLEGAVYEVRAAEEIRTEDGVLRLAAGELADTLTTDESGEAVSRELHFGTYTVTEVQAPEGYRIDPAPQTVHLGAEEPSAEVQELSLALRDERRRLRISVEKTMEEDPGYGIAAADEICDVSFGLYAAEAIPAADGTAIPADGHIAVLPVQTGGTAVLETELPFGSYYLKELSTGAHYVPGDEKLSFEFSPETEGDGDVTVSFGQNGSLENRLIRGSVLGKKTDGEGNALAGAAFGLFLEDAKIAETVSDGDGVFSFSGVPFGSYTVRELRAPEGYVTDETPHPVSIRTDGETVELCVSNDAKRGSVRLIKADEDFPEHTLSGAEFTVYRDSDGNGSYGLDDERIGAMTELEGGVYEMAELPAGDYFLKETRAPEGFRKDGRYYPFTIREDGDAVTVANDAESRCFVNAAEKGAMKIVKTSEDGKLEGFSFRVKSEDGSFDETFRTDGSGVIDIANLRPGNYTVEECADSVSKPYVLPEAKTVTVFASSVTTAEFHNALRPVSGVPKTGDPGQTALWGTLAALSLAVCLGAVFLPGKRRKRGKEAHAALEARGKKEE